MDIIYREHLKVFLFSLNILMNTRSTHCLKCYEFENNIILSVATNIGTTFLSNAECVLLISEKSNHLEDIVQHIELPQLHSRFYISLDEDEQKSCQSSQMNNIVKKSFEVGCTHFIVQLQNPLCFLNTWKFVSKISLQRHSPKILILPTEEKNIVSPDILKSNLTEFIFEMIIVDMYPNEISEKENSFKIITSDWNSKSKILADCKASECGKYLAPFPDKTLNFNKNVLKVATFNYPPYSILEPLEGTEVRIALEYARLHNCSIQIVTDEYQWGEIYENGSGNGILGNVAEEKAHVGFGALYLWFQEYKFVEFSIPYMRTGITCLVPKPKPLSTVLLPTRPFTVITWLIVFFVFIIACAALYYIKKLDTILLDSGRINKNHRHGDWFTSKADTLLRTFGFLVLQAFSNRTIEASTIRLLVNWLHVMFMLVATSYSSGLASILTVPSYQPPIDTVADLVNSKLEWGATHDAWIFSIREATEPNMKTLLNRFKALPSQQLYNNSFKENFAFSIERLPAGHFAVGDYITEESLKYLRLMKHDIYYEHCIIVFQKGSPYVKSFNTLVQRLSASGLLLFWEGEVARKLLRTNVQSAIRESSATLHRAHLTPIQLSHLLGPFIFLSLGLSLATISFIMEININCYSNIFHPRKTNKSYVE